MVLHTGRGKNVLGKLSRRKNGQKSYPNLVNVRRKRKKS
jgi:hypothetical protein